MCVGGGVCVVVCFFFFFLILFGHIPHVRFRSYFVPNVDTKRFNLTNLLKQQRKIYVYIDFMIITFYVYTDFMIITF